MLILDTDLYEPTKVALKYFLPLMPKGGIVVLDEVCYRNFAGETQALKEVLDLNKVGAQALPVRHLGGILQNLETVSRFIAYREVKKQACALRRRS